MRIIISARQAGKTTEIIRQASKDWLCIVCPNRVQVGLVADMAARRGMDIPFPITWYDFISKNYYGKNINGFAIDNLDMCISQESSVPIKVVSMTGSVFPIGNTGEDARKGQDAEDILNQPIKGNNG